jgi:hypothetical protein
MDIPGRIANGVVVLDGDYALPDGAQVVVSCTPQVSAADAVVVPPDAPLEQVLQVTRDVFGGEVHVEMVSIRSFQRTGTCA